MDLSRFFEILGYGFVSRALVVGILISLVAALLGVILVLKRYSLIGHGLADVGFASMSIALAFSVEPTFASVPLLILASVAIMFISERKGVGGDSAIAMVSTGSLALGVIITALTTGFNSDVYGYMFGSILAMSTQDLIFSAVLAIIVLVLFAIFFNRLFLVTQDEDRARSYGINVTAYHFLIALLTALTVVLGMRMMGTLLISSLIVFPTMTARCYTKSFKGTVIVAAIVSVCCFVVGMMVSLLFNLPTGAAVVAANIIVLLLSMVIRAIKK
jgi:zinc transport system permease protein